MPITLPPISRRRFLVGSLAAGAAVALQSRMSLATEEAVDPDRFVLLSDTHVAKDRAFVHKTNVNPWDHLQDVNRQLLPLTPRPAQVILCGDCACIKGLPGDYATLLDGIAPLRKAGIPIHLLLGNHDDRANFKAGIPADDARVAALEDRQVLQLNTPKANFFLLDSLIATERVTGEVGEQQRAWLAKSLDAAGDAPAIVFVHHNPDERTGKDRIGLEDSKAMLDLLLAKKQVKALFFGHTHDYQYEQRDGLHLVNLPPVSWLFKPGRPSGWVDLKLAAGGATMQLHTLGAHPQDGEKHELAWRS
jgi:Icc protein